MPHATIQRRREPGARSRADRGVGVFSSVFGLMIFLSFLLFAVQILYSLYATSVVNAAAYDAGRQVARSGDPAIGRARFEGVIGDYEASITFAFEGGTSFTDAEVIVVTVTGVNPTLLPDLLADGMPFTTVNRTIRIRNEKFVE